MKIESGTGVPHSAEVDDKFRLSTYAVTEEVESFSSSEGNSFNVNTGVINLTSANKSAVLYLANNGEDDIIINSIFYLIGNSTGGNGDVLVTVLRNPTSGTIVSGAVDCEMAGVNRNFGSNKTLVADTYKGAEGNTFTTGDKVIESILNQVPTRAALKVGSIVLKRGSSIGVDFTPAAGNTSVDIEVALSIHTVKED